MQACYIPHHFGREDFDRDKFNAWLALSRISPRAAMEEILVNIEATERSESRLLFRNAGVLFFAKNVRHFFNQAYITCLLFKGTARVDILDRKDFSGGIVADIEDSLRGCPDPVYEATSFFTASFYPNPAVRDQVTGEVTKQVTDQVGTKSGPSQDQSQKIIVGSVSVHIAFFIS